MQLEELVGTPVMFDGIVCHPYVHKTTANAYPDTSFIDAGNPLVLKGFAWRGIRFVYRPCCRQAADTMRIGDTLRMAYDVAVFGADTALGGSSYVNIVACGIEPST
ncbi:MAG: hypothetical protein GF331_00425, partial [Chitinivibrionales bacterium]|nr:hypothetical protein [Chitinivibrionales bacterium]